MLCTIAHLVSDLTLNSISLIAAGLDVEELAHEVNLNAGGDDDDEDLNERPSSDVAVVVLDERIISRLNSSRVCLILVPVMKDKFENR